MRPGEDEVIVHHIDEGGIIDDRSSSDEVAVGGFDLEAIEDLLELPFEVRSWQVLLIRSRSAAFSPSESDQTPWSGRRHH